MKAQEVLKKVIDQTGITQKKLAENQVLNISRQFST